jgi:hypothetical protein
MGTGRAGTEVQMFAMRMRVIVLRMCRDGTIDMGTRGVVLAVVMSVIVTMGTRVLVSMTMHRAIGMRMHMSVLMLVLITMDSAINARFAGTATASRAHFRNLQNRQS